MTRTTARELYCGACGNRLEPGHLRVVPLNGDHPFHCHRVSESQTLSGSPAAPMRTGWRWPIQGSR